MYEFEAYCSGPKLKIKKFLGENVYDEYDTITITFISKDKADGSPL